MKRKSRKQRQFEIIYGYYLIQDGTVFYKVVRANGQKFVYKASPEEIKDFIQFAPTPPMILIKEDFIWLFNMIAIYYRQFKIWQAKKLADARSKAWNGRRFYVLPDPNGKLRVVHRGNIKKLQAKGIMSKKVTFKDLINEAIYYTA